MPSEVKEVATLTAKESRSLADNEQVIERGLSTFYEVGSALLAIRDGRLYRATHKRFEDYCQERWKMTRMRASQLISAAESAGDVKNSLQKPNAHQAEKLSKVPRPDRAEVWEKVVESAPIFNGEPKITAKHVEKVVAKELKAEEPVEQHDYAGNVVPKKLASVFDDEPLFDTAIGHASALKAAVKEVANSSAGKFVNATTINRLIQEIRTALNEARPYAICPYCHGRKCSACAQSGIVPKTVLEQAQLEG